jgi:hypothetical protein
MIHARRRLQELISDPWLFASWLGLSVLIVLAPRLALDAGLTFDEDVQLHYGDLILEWLRSAGRDQRALDYRNLYLYGGLFDLVAQWIVSTEVSPWGPFETRHVFTALVAVLGVIATWRTAKKIRGARAGLFAALMLSFTPCWVGHGMFNPKDIPFAAAAAFVMYASVSIALSPSPLRWPDALRAALAFGIALGVRPGGMFLGTFPVFAAFARLALDAIANRPSRKALVRDASIVIARIACVIPISWALMLVAWPWAQLAPFERPFEAASIAAHFDWSGSMRFNGRSVTTADLPLTYLPVWFAVTLPETYLIAAASALACLVLAVRSRAVSRSSCLALSSLALFVVVPYAGVLLKRPIIYDAHRHFLFVLPPMAALSGIALSDLLEHPALPRALRLGVIALWIVAIGVVGFDMGRIHPYEYSYFNRIYGGLPAANGNFETDYWGASYREGFAWVVEHIQPTSRKPVRVAVCNDGPGRWQLNYLRERWHVVDKYIVVKREHQGEVYLGFTRGDCHKREGELLHTVDRQGVPLLYVFRRVASR